MKVLDRGTVCYGPADFTCALNGTQHVQTPRAILRYLEQSEDPRGAWRWLQSWASYALDGLNGPRTPGNWTHEAYLYAYVWLRRDYPARRPRGIDAPSP